MTPTTTLIAGLGGLLGDDRAGWHVVERIEARLAPASRRLWRLEKLASPADLLNLLSDWEQLILIDACQGLTTVGQVLQLRWPARELLRSRHAFGHNLSLAQVLDIAGQLGTLPAHCELWCIEGAQFELEHSLTLNVAAAADRLADDIVVSLVHTPP